MIGFVTAVIILSGLMWLWHRMFLRHELMIQQTRVRVHVNGIRGKSTVTRLVAGVLREAGFNTIAKTTGSAARIIHEDGGESPLLRRGAATIVEQIDIFRKYIKPETEALVIECMAVQPRYQKISQEKIVKGNITIITNVREDHQDVMGQTLPQIADALSTTIPRQGLLISAEERPALRRQLAANAAARGSQFLYADPAWVTDADLRGFDYLSFKENLAIGLAIANILDIPHETAMRGMRKALPDVGAVFVQPTLVQGKEIVWAPLFAVNDRESAIIGVEALQPYYLPGATQIGLLNNRSDRASRAIQFAEIAALDLKLDYYITFGAYEMQVTERMVALGYPRDQIFNLGFSRNPPLSEILDQIVALTQGHQALLIGLVNIHTPQAELLMEFFHHLKAEQRQGNGLTYGLSYVSEQVKRRRYLLSHLLKQRGS